MNTSLQQLVSLIPPPREPVAPGSPNEWPRVESEIGTLLPQDFKDYISIYGAGQWADFFGIMNPFYKWKHPQASETWREWMHMRIGSLEQMRRESPKDTAPFLPHRAAEGLLAFGYNDNGGTICWHMRGQPVDWPIVCIDAELSERYDCFAMSLTAFLAALMAEKIQPRTFAPDLFPIQQPAFRPYTTE